MAAMLCGKGPSISLGHCLRIHNVSRVPPRAWRPGLEPAELSFRVPHFFHQTRRGFRGPRISIMMTSLAIKK
jgi:hypothetical protein